MMGLNKTPLYHGDQWVLDGRENQYLGGVAVNGKKVLDVGTATGHIAFWCASQGADVIALDVPNSIHRRGFKLRQKSHPPVQYVEGDAERLGYGPDTFDIVILGAILMHLLDPFAAVAGAAHAAKESVIVTAGTTRLRWIGWRLGLADREPTLAPFYAPRTHWRVPPRWTETAFRVLGMVPRTSWHRQRAFGRWHYGYTTVGRWSWE